MLRCVSSHSTVPSDLQTKSKPPRFPVKLEKQNSLYRWKMLVEEASLEKG